MNYRLNKFFARRGYNVDTVIVEDIKIQDPISSIVIGVGVKNYTHTRAAHPVACVEKIELVDGSDVLFSLDGYEAEALDWYNNGGKFRYNRNLALTDNEFQRYIGINFGRWLWDTDYAFVPRNFTNPQLRITLNIDAASNQTDYIYVTIWANLFDEKIPSPRGFLMSKEIKEYTIADAEHEYTDMPLDFPYRGLYARPFLAGTYVSECVSNLRLSEDQDKRIPFDHGVQDILRSIQEDLPPVRENYVLSCFSNLHPFFVAPAERVCAVGSGWRTAVADYKLSFYGGGGGKLQFITNCTGPNMQMQVEGYCPHAVIQIPFGLKNDPADWYDVRRIGNLRLDITGAKEDAKGFIFLQQERLY